MPTTPHPFAVDHPISQLEDDKLNRRSFALSIAKAIESWKGDASLVIALYGGWGDGKSSVKGMVMSTLAQDDSRCPIFVEFSPWEWSGRNQLAEAFFEEIGGQLGSDDKHKGAKAAGERLRTLGRFLALGSSVTRGIGVAANLFLPGTGVVVEAAAKGLKQSSELTTQASEAMDEQAALRHKNLPQIKNDTKSTLGDLDRNILVLIDDVDRLMEEEIKLLFQLIKTNSDFPNLIFFLFFQRNIVENALENTTGHASGQDYLKKIVQVPLTLPAIQPNTLNKLFRERLNALLSSKALTTRFDEDRFADMSIAGIAPYFRNLRDITRFFSTFEFHLGVFDSPMEFNAVDLLAVEVLRHFEDQLYQTLNDLRDVLFPAGWKVTLDASRGFEASKQWAKAIETVINAAPVIRKDAATYILKALFPMDCFGLLDRRPKHLLSLIKSTRIAHPAFFDRYFQLCVPIGDLPQQDLETLRSSLSSVAHFKSELGKLDNHGLALTALERLLTYSEDFDSNNGKGVATTLYDLSDSMAGKYESNMTRRFVESAIQLVQMHLIMVDNPEHRFAILRDAINESTGLLLILEQVLHERASTSGLPYQNSPDPGPQIPTRVNGIVVLSPEHLSELERLFLVRIDTWADSGALNTHTHIKRLLCGWRELGQRSKVREFCSRFANDQAFILTFLDQFLGINLDTSLRAGFVNALYPQDFHLLSEFFDLNALAASIRAFNLAKLTHHEKQLCTVFTNLMQVERPASAGSNP